MACGYGRVRRELDLECGVLLFPTPTGMRADASSDHLPTFGAFAVL